MLASKLALVLAEVVKRDKDSQIIRNRVGNLSILDKDGIWLGYIDIGPGNDDEELQWWEDLY